MIEHGVGDRVIISKRELASWGKEKYAGEWICCFTSDNKFGYNRLYYNEQLAQDDLGHLKNNVLQYGNVLDVGMGRGYWWFKSDQVVSVVNEDINIEDFM